MIRFIAALFFLLVSCGYGAKISGWPERLTPWDRAAKAEVTDGADASAEEIWDAVWPNNSDLEEGAYGVKVSELSQFSGTVADGDEWIMNDYSASPTTRRISASDMRTYMEGDISAADITDSTATGQAAMTAADPAALRDAAGAASGVFPQTTVEVVDLSASPPATPSSTGTPGQVVYAGNYLYICIATDTWKRAQLMDW